MQELWQIFVEAYKGYAAYLWHEITHPGPRNYFYWLIGVSLFFFALEILRPWRKNQPIFRKDFWLDLFYMFFNFFLFSLIIYNAASSVIVHLLNDGILNLTGLNLQANNPMQYWPAWAILLTGFIVRDFVQWNTHRLLHRVPRLWEYHKVHHSVEQMGFAAHLRYHWMETIVYRSIEYLPLALLGIGLHDFFIIHIFTLAVGHYNHSNVTVDAKVSGLIFTALLSIVFLGGYFDVTLIQAWSLTGQLLFVAGLLLIGYFVLGPFMKRIFNSPEMHIWHHAKEIPQEKKYGVNFGITLALWDYLFGTVYWPSTGRDIALGFERLKEFPRTFWQQIRHGF